MIFANRISSTGPTNALPFAFAVTLLQSTGGPELRIGVSIFFAMSWRRVPYPPHHSCRAILRQGAAALAEKTPVRYLPTPSARRRHEHRAQQVFLLLRGKPAARGFFIGRRINGKSPV